MAASEYKVRIVKDDGETEVVPASENVARPFADYAILCTSVYAPGVTEIERGDRLDQWSSCKKRLPTPDGWARCIDIEGLINNEKSRMDLEGLVLEVWMKAISRRPNIVALIYRGTATGSDWLSNLNWFIGRRLRVTDKYSQLRQLLAVLLPEIKRTYGDVSVVAAGHSLGGGLAQFSAYAHDCIKQVYAFDPSPVTGYFSIERNVRQQNAEHVKIARIYARFEALAFLRGPIKWLRNRVKRLVLHGRTRVHITEYRFNFERRTPFKQHSMGILAWHLNHISR